MAPKLTRAGLLWLIATVGNHAALVSEFPSTCSPLTVFEFDALLYINTFVSQNTVFCLEGDVTVSVTNAPTTFQTTTPGHFTATETADIFSILATVHETPCNNPPTSTTAAAVDVTTSGASGAATFQAAHSSSVNSYPSTITPAASSSSGATYTTITLPWTGTDFLSSPLTVTIPGDNGQPGTIVVYTPVASLPATVVPSTTSPSVNIQSSATEASSPNSPDMKTSASPSGLASTANTTTRSQNPPVLPGPSSLSTLVSIASYTTGGLSESTSALPFTSTSNVSVPHTVGSDSSSSQEMAGSSSTPTSDLQSTSQSLDQLTDGAPISTVSTSSGDQLSSTNLGDHTTLRSSTSPSSAVDSPSAGSGLLGSSETSASLSDTSTNSLEMSPTVPGISNIAASPSVSSDTTTNTDSATTTLDQPSSSLPSTAAASSSSTVTSIVPTEESSTSSINSPTTTASFTETSLNSTSASISTSSVASAPEFDCRREGFYIRNDAAGTSLYTINLQSGATSLVTNNLNGPAGVDAIGYNAFDGRLYGVQSNPPKILTIDSAGDVTPVLTLPVDILTYDCADVDEQGHMWIASGGQSFYEIDLAAMAIIASGTAARPYVVFDWAYVPGGGDYLYAPVVAPNGYFSLFRFDRTAHTWSQLSTGYTFYYSGTRFGAVYAAADGSLYATEESGGYIFLFGPDGQTLIVTGIMDPGQNTLGSDGTHCLLSNA